MRCEREGAVEVGGGGGRGPGEVEVVEHFCRGAGARWWWTSGYDGVRVVDIFVVPVLVLRFTTFLIQ